jgi:hypothetical protein
VTWGKRKHVMAEPGMIPQRGDILFADWDGVEVRKTK